MNHEAWEYSTLEIPNYFPKLFNSFHYPQVVDVFPLFHIYVTFGITQLLNFCHVMRIWSYSIAAIFCIPLQNFSHKVELFWMFMECLLSGHVFCLCLHTHMHVFIFVWFRVLYIVEVSILLVIYVADFFFGLLFIVWCDILCSFRKSRLGSPSLVFGHKSNLFF